MLTVVDSVLGKSCIEISDTDAICGRIVSLESTQLVPANDIQTGRNKLDRRVEIVDMIGILHINDVPLIQTDDSIVVCPNRALGDIPTNHVDPSIETTENPVCGALSIITNESRCDA